MIAGLAIMAGSSILGGLSQDRAAAKQAKAQNKAALRQNRENFILAERSVLSMELQKAALRQQTAKSLDLANRMQRGSAGGVTAAAAAAGMKGSAVDAVHSEVQADFQAKQYELEQHHIYGEYDITQQQVNALEQYRSSSTPLQKAGTRSLGSHVLEGLGQAATTYASQYFKFGSATDDKDSKAPAGRAGSSSFYKRTMTTSSGGYYSGT